MIARKEEEEEVFIIFTATKSLRHGTTCRAAWESGMAGRVGGSCRREPLVQIAQEGVGKARKPVVQTCD